MKRLILRIKDWLQIIRPLVRKWAWMAAWDISVELMV